MKHVNLKKKIYSMIKRQNLEKKIFPTHEDKFCASKKYSEKWKIAILWNKFLHLLVLEGKFATEKKSVSHTLSKITSYRPTEMVTLIQLTNTYVQDRSRNTEKILVVLLTNHFPVKNRLYYLLTRWILLFISERTNYGNRIM